MDPLVAATLIDTGANLVGGFLNKNKGPKPMSDKDMLGWNQANFENMTDSSMNMAKKHGIHPLVMLGFNPGAGQVTPAFGSSDSGGSRFGDFLQTAGQGISRAVNAYMTRDERTLAKQSMALDLENKRLQNTRLASEIRLMNSPGNPPPLPSDPLGGKAYPRNAHLVDGDGRTIRVLNPDAGDNEFLMGWDFMSRTLPDEAKAMTGRSWQSLKNFFKRGRIMGRDLSRFQK